MANTVSIKRRIKSVKSTRQITKAMELVAASKMRRAQEAAIASRDYSLAARQILTRLRQLTDVGSHPLFSARQISCRLLVAITSDRGLAGAYNNNVLKEFTAQLKSDNEQTVGTKALLIGRQASRFASKIANLDVVAAYDRLPENISEEDLLPILSNLTSLFESGQVDAVDVIFTDYKSSLTQEVKVQRLLPAAFTEAKVSSDLDVAIFEPSPKAVLDFITSRLIEVQLWQFYLESQASEQSARMMAMKTASDNAGELIDDLTLAANTARQAAITQELAEITGGVEAIK